MLLFSSREWEGKAIDTIYWLRTGQIRGQRTGWSAKLSRLWSAAQSPAENQSFNDASPGLILGRILLKLFIDDLDTGTGYRLDMFAYDIKLRGPVDTPDGCAAIWKDLNRYKKWAYRNLIKFSQGESQVLHLSRNNPMH